MPALSMIAGELKSNTRLGMLKMASHLSQTDLNYEAFVVQLPQLLPDHAGSYALLHDQEVVDFFASSLAATVAGAEKFGVGQFSVQEVTDEPEHLGFYSYVGGTGEY